MRSLFASLVLCLSLWAHAAGPELPALTQPVIDQVGLFTEKQGQDLARDIRELSEQGGPQVGVLVVDNLQGYTIEDFSIRVAEAWKLGSEKKDDGVIILIAPKDRKIRIEVGGGVEGEITDLEASRWIRQVLRPAFKEQDYAGGVAAVLREIAAKFNVKLAGGPVARRVRRDREELSPASIIVLLILVFIVLPILNRGRGFRSFGGRGGYYGGGSGGGWSSGGGGSSWGGGGGGFSGGGASGDW